MSERVYLKLQNRTVMEFNTHEGYYRIFYPELMPYILRDRMVPSGEIPDYTDSARNQEALLDFFSNRSLSIKRENAKNILNALNISQKNGYETKYKTMILCKGLSVSDDYWITDKASDRWEDVNLRDNPLHETIAQIALFGKSLTITGPVRTPELTGQGAYAKAWYREKGNLYLYKASTKGGKEAETEASVSSILDCTNVPHVAYTLTEKNGRTVTRCKNMCSDTLSIVDADDIIAWCSRTGRNFDQLVMSMDANLFYQTVIVDYLVANRDRHGANWGFYMDNATGTIVGIHPLFDHNNAFSEEFMEDPTGGICQLIPGKSQKEAAMYAVKHCDFRITKDIPRKLFPDAASYQCFMERACELGLFQKQSPSILQKLKLQPFQEYTPAELKPDNRDDYLKMISDRASSAKNTYTAHEEKKQESNSQHHLVYDNRSDSEKAQIPDTGLQPDDTEEDMER